MKLVQFKDFLLLGRDVPSSQLKHVYRFHFLIKWIHTMIGVRMISRRNTLKIRVCKGKNKAYWLF